MVSISVQQPIYDSKGNQHSLRLRLESLPKFTFGADLDTWVIRMDHLVKLWVETNVCPHIHANSFVNGDTIEIWYFTLESIIQQAIKEHPRCWD